MKRTKFLLAENCREGCCISEQGIEKAEVDGCFRDFLSCWFVCLGHQQQKSIESGFFLGYVAHNPTSTDFLCIGN